MKLDTFESHCDHPGCHDLHGEEDPILAAKGTYREGMNRTELLAEVKREEAEETRPLMKLALLDLAEAVIRGEGGREAYRRIRVASVHN